MVTKTTQLNAAKTNLTTNATDASSPSCVVHLEDRGVQKFFRISKSNSGNVEGTDEMDPTANVRLFVHASDNGT